MAFQSLCSLLLGTFLLVLCPFLLDAGNARHTRRPRPDSVPVPGTAAVGGMPEMPEPIGLDDLEKGTRVQLGAVVCVDGGDCDSRLRAVGYADAHLAAQRRVAEATARDHGIQCKEGKEPCLAAGPRRIMLGPLDSMIIAV
eukprot:CAMPEP_0197897330 /NCGR_PEP_ID=MMETSP1439-20131203/42126_1 /TAXON_ID=66791 /ORGANISM="Gonyaulax spinifera, Strain CCMP409" /LENGTH=140 /DNA_ID=CAMNT_0043517955 /DNA_START=97 /DNA_END=519 /DNA_ORIENTATION=-